MLLYKWMTEKQLKKIIDNDMVRKSRWRHFIQEDNCFHGGSSWSYNPMRWKYSSTCCLIIHDDGLKGFHINGNRTYLQTQGMINNLYDEKAYLLEEEKPDEYFIPGSIKDVKNKIRAIVSNNLFYDDIETYENIQIFLKNIPNIGDITMDYDILDIAKKYFHIGTLETQNSGLDFHEIAVWNMKEALNKAFQLGGNDIDISNDIDNDILDIAKQCFHIDTLDTQNSGLDFHEVAVWNMKEALNKAFQLGKDNCITTMKP